MLKAAHPYGVALWAQHGTRNNGARSPSVCVVMHRPRHRRVDAIWLTCKPMDMRVGPQTAQGRAVRAFGEAPSHHVHLFPIVGQPHEGTPAEAAANYHRIFGSQAVSV